MLSRRTFLSALGATSVGAAAILPALDRRALASDAARSAARVAPRPVLADLILLDKNENPAGPFPSARRAIEAAFPSAGRYPGAAEGALREALAAQHRVRSDQIVLGCGSTEVLELATREFTSGSRALVTAVPSFENPAALAAFLGRPVRSVPVTGTLHLDLDAMAAAARGAGLVFVCNPNNPTGTVHEAAAVREFIGRVRRESPDTYILVDEAYHEYVDLPGYATMIPETRDDHVVVVRTFSKVFGMAGVRVGYAVTTPRTASRLSQVRWDTALSRLAIAGAIGSLGDAAALAAERRRNGDVRAATVRWFTERGFAPAPSHTNFVFVDIKRPVQPVIAACFDKGVAVGRPFPPLLTHLRLSVGTRDEMTRALAALGAVLQVRG